MPLQRRRFLNLTAGACASTACATTRDKAPDPVAPTSTGDRWNDIRAEFDLDPDYANLTGFLLAPHPRRVREAIARHRDALDRNPVLVLEPQLSGVGAGEVHYDSASRTSAAAFLGAAPGEIALTDSTTMGLGLVYGGLRLPAGAEVLASSHGHYSTHEALRLRTARDGIAVRTIELYKEPSSVSVAEVVGNLRAGISARTRVVAATWVHSSTGVKMPIRAMADAIAAVNRKRSAAERILLVVDGVHGFGLENFTVAELGCDVFIAGCHKWLFGPRGTGLVWAKPEAWAAIAPTIAAFEGAPFLGWLRGEVPQGAGGPMNTPGGFHSFEHRWALSEAFAFQAAIGRADIEGRVHELNRRLKQGLARNKRVRLRTPVDETLSAGITAFDVDEVAPQRVVQHLLADKILASVSPYRVEHVRLAPGLLNTPEQVDEALASLARV